MKAQNPFRRGGVGFDVLEWVEGGKFFCGLQSVVGDVTATCKRCRKTYRESVVQTHIGAVVIRRERCQECYEAEFVKPYSAEVRKTRRIEAALPANYRKVFLRSLPDLRRDLFITGGHKTTALGGIASHLISRGRSVLLISCTNLRERMRAGEVAADDLRRVEYMLIDNMFREPAGQRGSDVEHIIRDRVDGGRRVVVASHIEYPDMAAEELRNLFRNFVLVDSSALVKKNELGRGGHEL